MTKYMFAYHGGKTPETPEEGAKEMEKWKQWMGGMGASLVDGGNPVGMSTTVSAKGVANDGGANPLSGYSIIEASNLDEAVAHAKGCPICESGGSVEVAEIVNLM